MSCWGGAGVVMSCLCQSQVGGGRKMTCSTASTKVVYWVGYAGRRPNVVCIVILCCGGHGPERNLHARLGEELNIEFLIELVSGELEQRRVGHVLLPAHVSQPSSER